MSIDNVIKNELEGMSEDYNINLNVVRKLYELAYGMYKKQYSSLNEVKIVIDALETVKDTLKNKDGDTE